MCAPHHVRAAAVISTSPGNMHVPIDRDFSIVSIWRTSVAWRNPVHHTATSVALISPASYRYILTYFPVVSIVSSVCLYRRACRLRRYHGRMLTRADRILSRTEALDVHGLFDFRDMPCGDAFIPSSYCCCFGRARAIPKAMTTTERMELSKQPLLACN